MPEIRPARSMVASALARKQRSGASRRTTDSGSPGSSDRGSWLTYVHAPPRDPTCAGSQAGSTRHSNGGRSTSTGSAPATTPAPTGSTPTSSPPAPTASAPAIRRHHARHAHGGEGSRRRPFRGLDRHRMDSGSDSARGGTLGFGLVRYLRRRRDDGPMAGRRVDPVAPVQPQAPTVVDNAPGNGGRDRQGRPPQRRCDRRPRRWAGQERARRTPRNDWRYHASAHRYQRRIRPRGAARGETRPGRCGGRLPPRR